MKRKKSRPETVICRKCGQRGDERPGLKVDWTARAVGFGDGEMVATHNITCQRCGHLWPEPVGSFTVIREAEAQQIRLASAPGQPTKG